MAAVVGRGRWSTTHTGAFGDVEAVADYLWRLCCRFLLIPADPGGPAGPAGPADAGTHR